MNTGVFNGSFKADGTNGTPFQVFNGTATATFCQGYPLGAAGQGTQGNAAGGGNDGNPTASNGQNSGGGNASAGGLGGNNWINNSVAGGALGYEGCCGGGAGNGSPKPYSSTVGTAELATTLAGSPLGVGTGSACLPLLTVTKSTSTPTVTLPGGTTAQYSINVSNAATAGAAYGVSLSDVLPVPFGLQTVGATSSVAFSGTNTSGLTPTAANQSGNTTTAVFGVGGTGNAPTVSSFTVFSGGSVTVSFVVNINPATPGTTFQNSARATFTDPTRAAGGAASSASSNATVTSGGLYASGAAVGGSNYASGSSTAEDVVVVATTTLSVAKTNAVSTVTAGGTTSYTLTFSNNGGYAANNALIKDIQSAGLNCTSVMCVSTTGAASCPTGLVLATPTPAASVPNLFNGTGITIPTFPAVSTVVLTVDCGVTATGH